MAEKPNREFHDAISATLSLESVQAQMSQLSQKEPWVHRFHRFTQMNGTLTGQFWEGRFGRMGVRGGAGVVLFEARYRRPHGPPAEPEVAFCGPMHVEPVPICAICVICGFSFLS
jgi:hypothetical protein